MTALNGKTALVTGAARGIGAAIARGLAKAGARVIINYAQSADVAENLAREIGGDALAVQANIASITEIEAMRDAIADKVGKIDILVNNAGISTMGPAPLKDMDVEEFDALFATNTRGVFFVTQRMLPLLNDGGAIVNISSAAVTKRLLNYSAYAGTKAAVEAFTRYWCAEAEVAYRKITVNAISPGLVETDLTVQILPPAVREARAADHPFGRIGQPDDIANVVVFLASGAAEWVNGQTIITNGGA